MSSYRIQTVEEPELKQFSARKEPGGEQIAVSAKALKVGNAGVSSLGILESTAPGSSRSTPRVSGGSGVAPKEQKPKKKLGKAIGSPSKSKIYAVP